MLRRIDELPTDKTIAGVHSVPLLDDGSIVMVWDRNEQVLTTVGGRIEAGEHIDQALNREAVEEAGILLKPERIPFACWYWTETDTYTVFVLARVDSFVPIPEGFETTGRVVMNFETALQMVNKIEGRAERTQILSYARELASELLSR
ncbi:NUDIX hydrolase [Gordoniibacillus kamchatkensis]|uniref:NUDIX hydrolase n=1 Tax=Gordoniibacillus kamchatkensis TaxID=1590651 RepID=A0ABR5AFU8_9BACL|nr:NUDIX domain-containing protein [Paenibacillus sp. VKM B-2647]KIL39445.1 NUDIX hydrolase [Paenibacillus sp. VKM B-2647]